MTTKIRDLHDEHEREFTASALEVLVDQAMGEWSFDLPATERQLRKGIGVVLKAEMSPMALIEWAAQISGDILTFEEFTALHVGD